MSEPTARTEEYLDALAKAATRIADALDRMEPRHFDATATARVVDLTADLTAPTTYNPGGQLPHGWTRDWLWNGHAAPMSAAEAGQATQDAASPSGGSVDPPATAGASGDPLDESDHRDRLLTSGGQIRRHGERHWHLLSTIQCSRRHDAFSECALANWDDEFGPLTFAPEVDQ